VYRGTATGAWSELVVVDERVALPTGGQLPLEQAALLGCAALTGVGAVLFAARVRPGAAVLVVGAGGVGQFCVQGARIAGADVVVVADPVEGRRQRALELGATHAAAPDELEAALADAAPDGVDYGFDAVGDAATTALMLAHTASGGVAVVVGLPPAGQRLDFDPAHFIRREKWLTGTMYGSEDPAVALPQLLAYVREGKLDLSGQLGPVYALEDINEAVEESLAGSAGRVLVTP
jgi:S-(hydroxymethyl)glutathione dehydrogenase/alcohol dehydrogenase